MVYQGSNYKVLSQMLPVIQQYIDNEGITQFYDIFCGSAEVATNINCQEIYANDLSPTLIALHQQAQQSFSVIPSECTKDQWDLAYNDYRKILSCLSPRYSIEDYQKRTILPLYVIGAYEWYGSFNAGGFIKGFAQKTEARDFFTEHRNNHYSQSQRQEYKKIKFSTGDFRNLQIPPNALIYCDPPHKGLDTYQILRNFPYLQFYQWLDKISLTNPVFVNECTMPDKYSAIAVRNVNHKGHVRTEKLYLIDNRGEYHD